MSLYSFDPDFWPNGFGTQISSALILLQIKLLATVIQKLNLWPEFM